ncbi:Ribosomal RNA processing protein 1 B [Bulinus truncatus]|nr:Ribosomal RNA processing protein 1 B [Bulinus truncatus]
MVSSGTAMVSAGTVMVSAGTVMVSAGTAMVSAGTAMNSFPVHATINMEKHEVSAEVHFAQKLAANEKKIRDRAIKRLQKYLTVRSNHGGLNDDDLLKIWKGLFYCMWMQDKPLIQEELSHRITNLINCFPSTMSSLKFVKVFFETYAREWNGIDRLRLDKFLMMMRDMLRQTFSLLSKDEWPLDECILLARTLAKHVMQPDKFQLPDGLKLHLADIFVDEISKQPLEKMSSKKMVVLLEPFLYFILNSNKIELVKRVMLDVVYRAVDRFSGKVPQPLLWEQKMYKRKKKSKNTDTAVEENIQAEVEAEPAETEAMEVEETQNLFSLNKRLLLLLMFKQAEKKTIKAPNRALIYKFVNEFPEEHTVINNLINSQKSEDKDENENNCAADVGELEKLLHELDEKAVNDQTRQRTKKKKKKHNREKDPEETVSNPSAKDIITGATSKKDKKGLNCDKKSKLNVLAKKIKKCDKENLVANGNLTLQNSVLCSEKTHKISQLSDAVDGKKKVVVEPVTLNDSHTIANSRKNKKRKRQSSENSDEVVASKRSKISEDKIISDTCLESPFHADSKISSTGHPVKDSNSNARSRSRSKSPTKPATGSVELVTYSVKHPNEPTAVIVLDKIHGRPSQKGSSPSPKKEPPPKKEHSNLAINSTSSSPPKSAKASDKNNCVVGVAHHSNTVGEVPKVLHTPCSTLKMFATSDPGPSCHNKNDKSFSTPGISMTPGIKKKVFDLTPGTKKKVVFDLRRNKANKFKDYLMSLAKQPDPPYEPTKSPSVSILKSPNIQQCAASPDSDTKSDTDVSQLSLNQILNSHKKKSVGRKKH